MIVVVKEFSQLQSQSVSVILLLFYNNELLFHSSRTTILQFPPVRIRPQEISTQVNLHLNQRHQSNPNFITNFVCQYPESKKNSRHCLLV